MHEANCQSSDHGRRTHCPTIVIQTAESRLRRSGYATLSGVRCEFDQGTLRLRGQLPTYYLKQLALALVTDVEGVRSVINQITVVAPALVDSDPSEGGCRAPYARST